MDGKALAERIEAEASAAEAEHPDDPGYDDEEDESDEDTQVEPESQPPALTDQEVERAFKNAEKEAAKYEARLEKVLGPIFADLQPSPIDDVPGYVFAFDPATDIGDYKRAAVASYFGDNVKPLKPHSRYKRCESCDGYREVLTGAQDEATMTQPCPDCNGMGWLDTKASQAQGAYQPVPGEIVPPPLDANGAGGEPDAFKRPWGHPHYGEIPLFTGDN